MVPLSPLSPFSISQFYNPINYLLHDLPQAQHPSIPAPKTLHNAFSVIISYRITSTTEQDNKLTIT